LRVEWQKWKVQSRRGAVSPFNFRLKTYNSPAMPTYEYACPKCGHEFELFQTMSAAPLKKCPKCGKTGVKRLIGAGAGLIFKGTGFYITDYRKGPPPPAEGGGDKGGGTEAKPAGKAADAKAGPPAVKASEGKPSEAKPAAGRADK